MAEIQTAQADEGSGVGEGQRTRGEAGKLGDIGTIPADLHTGSFGSRTQTQLDSFIKDYKAPLWCGTDCYV